MYRFMFKVIGIEYDVIVIGAGPAGCAAALKAQEDGSSVIVLEKRTRDQIVDSNRTSFEGLQNLTQKRDALDLISDMGFSIDPEYTYKGAVVHGPSGKKASFYLNRPHGYFIRRQGPNSLDHQMINILEKENINIQFGCLVIEVQPDGMVLYNRENQENEIKTNLIIGADGKNTIAGKGIAKPLYRKEIAIGMGYHFKGPHGFEPGTAECWLGSDICPGEYAYALASEDEVTVVTAMRPHLLPTGSKPMDYLQQFISIPEVKERIGNAKKVCKVFGSVPVLPGGPLGNGRILLVGEAARLTDPLLGFGMMNAIRSGHLAGKAASTNNPFKYYSGSVDSEIIGDLRKRMRARDRIIDALEDDTIDSLLTVMNSIIEDTDPNLIFDPDRRWSTIGSILRNIIFQGHGKLAMKYLLPLITSNFSLGSDKKKQKGAGPLIPISSHINKNQLERVT